MSQIIEETKNNIMNLKVQLKEERRMEEVVRIQLNKKEENYEEIEFEIVSLRMEPEKTTINLNRSLNFEKITEILDHIINCKRSPFIKTSLGYDVVVSSLLLGSKDVLKTTSMHQPKVGIGTSVLLVAYVSSYLPFSIPNLQRCNTYKGTSIVKGMAVVLFKGTTLLAKGTTIVTLGRTNVELIAL
jgi:hypothetical protein